MGLSANDTAARSRTLDLLGLVAMGFFVLGPLLAWLRLVPALVGFALFALGGLLALVVTLLAVIRAARGRGFGRGGVLAASVAALVFVWSAARSGGGPRINDFTTDPSDPPTYKQATSEPANAQRDMAYPAAFAEVQRECCPDLAPIALANVAPAAAFTEVETVAAGMPSWHITRRDPAAGELEAVATTALFGFQDDVAIRVRPDPSSGGSRVDVRSKSRDGQGDMGTNAARIRTFRDALAARVAAGDR
jgi:uncharacterized protein (DUF1499 family)